MFSYADPSYNYRMCINVTVVMTALGEFECNSPGPKKEKRGFKIAPPQKWGAKAPRIAGRSRPRSGPLPSPPFSGRASVRIGMTLHVRCAVRHLGRWQPAGVPP